MSEEHDLPDPRQAEQVREAADRVARGESRDREGAGEGRISEGEPAGDSLPAGSFSPSGEHPRRHWQASRISKPGIDDRGDVFFAAVEMTRMPMILTDPKQPDNPIVFANRAFQDLTGYDEAEIVGRNCRFLQGAQTDRETVREMRDAIAEHRATSIEVLNYKRDGTPFWNAVFIGPVFDQKGELIYFFASQLDVTRRRTSEQAFRQAQKMEAIGQLTAGLAHDFNNLLQVIAGNIESALNQTADDTIRRRLENASRAAERGAKLTKQLLAFARKTRLEPKPVNLNTLIVDFGDMLERTLGDTVDLRLNLKSRLPACLVDPVHLEMALLNVLINARDAMPRGGEARIETFVKKLNGEAAALNLRPGDYVVLQIVDQGEGMPAHVVERATEPFFTTKGPAKGTGLGLAMVHGFVQQSHGRLEIESRSGEGATVRMPFPATTEGATGVRPAEKPLGTVAPRGGASETILVVEDNEDVLQLAQDHLEGLGYRVIAARDAEEAMRVIESRKHLDLLFTDLVMPGGMNGLDLAQKTAELRPDLPVLLTTGYNEELVVDGPRTPAMDVIGKPYRRTELADRVRAALNRSAAERQEPEQPQEA